MRDQTDCDIIFYTYSAIEFIEEAMRQSNGQAKILVHCYKGNSRSAAVVAGYLMWKRGMNSKEAIEYIRQRRGFIDPNLGFVGQLIKLHLSFQDQNNYTKAASQTGQNNNISKDSLNVTMTSCGSIAQGVQSTNT